MREEDKGGSGEGMRSGEKRREEVKGRCGGVVKKESSEGRGKTLSFGLWNGFAGLNR